MSGERQIHNLALIGFMGTGKSSVGRMVAAQLHFDFVDTDHMIESRTGKKIADIFTQAGEAGYRIAKRGKKYSPLWHGQFKPLDKKLALGFRDLIEIKFVDAFLNVGVSWDVIHKVRDEAAKLFPNESHPFCTRRFMTDGQEIFVQVHDATREPSLIELGKSQQVFADIIVPFLKELEFGQGDILERWWPRGKEHGIAVDPKRNFGQPSLFKEGIPTRVLARSFKPNESVEEVARWYEITPEVVQEAVEFEHQLAA